MGFRFNNRDQQSVEDIFNRLIQPEQVEEDYDSQDDQSLSSLPLTPEFIRDHTTFGTYADFVLKSPVDLNQCESALSNDEWEALNGYIAQNTDYASYQAMKKAVLED